MRTNLRVLFSALLCVCLATGSSGAQAEMLNPDRAASIERLAAQGVDPVEAAARVAVLTDEEVSVLASGFEELPAGGRDPRGLLAVAAVAAMVYVIIKLLPFILIGGGVAAVAKVSADQRS